MAEAQELLRSIFGFADFLPGQAEVVDALLAGRDAIAIMPTGSGKSLLYQLPAAAPGGGLVLVCSPLIALMRDQLRTLADKGLSAVALHSMQEDEEAAAIDAVASGRAKLLYAAPERLAQEGTQHLLRNIRIKLFAIDEAHCVSHWGHEFRPDYRALGEIARKLGAPPMLAVTATASPRTRDDIVRTLFSRPPQIFQRSFARPNLSLDFAQKRAGLRQTVDFARKGGAKESGIIYCNSRNKTDTLARELSRLGFDALPYHAGLDAHTRSESQDAFFTHKGAVMVATIAFGMGVDKPDVRFIVHADLPTSVEGYYQEIGRAGRDGAPARALTLFSPAELALRWRIPEAAQDNEAAAGDYARRQAMARLAAAPGCRFMRLLAEFGEESAPCGRCDHCRGGPIAWPRRLSSLALGWRAALASGFASRDDVAEVEEDISQIAPAPTSAPIQQEHPPLTVDEARLLCALEAERLAIAKRRGVAPRTVASEQALRALARERPKSAGDPLLHEIADAAALLRVIDQAR
ncbi:MAG: ATP-dependent DNA helicase RecQ [Alphaproteobacteria bacterium]|nr:ATP-dependent DNA helicase RecQ [Alphaproteobacteria bacterium]MBM3624041.1 ATP-dependent DNA helicase RecQ [Alphaproteobacteria bacterium]MBM3640104.1 ATP-dependent DNA helicase RecQ [Alphaproteobacteria bacterium]